MTQQSQDYRNKLAYAYKIAGEAIRTYDTKAECTMREALAKGPQKPQPQLRATKPCINKILGTLFELAFAFIAFAILPGIIVLLICWACKLDWKTTLICIGFLAGPLGIFGLILSIGDLGHQKTLENNKVIQNNWTLSFANSFIEAVRPLSEEDLEELFLFMRHQGIVQMKQDKAFGEGHASGHNEGYRQGYDDGYTDGWGT